MMFRVEGELNISISCSKEKLGGRWGDICNISDAIGVFGNIDPRGVNGRNKFTDFFAL